MKNFEFSEEKQQTPEQKFKNDCVEISELKKLYNAGQIDYSTLLFAVDEFNKDADYDHLTRLQAMSFNATHYTEPQIENFDDYDEDEYMDDYDETSDDLVTELVFGKYAGIYCGIKEGETEPIIVHRITVGNENYESPYESTSSSYYATAELNDISLFFPREMSEVKIENENEYHDAKIMAILLDKFEDNLYKQYSGTETGEQIDLETVAILDSGAIDKEILHFWNLLRRYRNYFTAWSDEKVKNYALEWLDTTFAKPDADEISIATNSAIYEDGFVFVSRDEGDFEEFTGKLLGFTIISRIDREKINNDATPVRHKHLKDIAKIIEVQNPETNEKQTVIVPIRDQIQFTIPIKISNIELNNDTNIHTPYGKFEHNNIRNFINSLNSSHYNSFFTYYSKLDYDNMDLYKFEKFNCGFALKADLDEIEIVSLHNNSPIRGLGRVAINYAISLGGNKLDHFDGFLSTYYESLGFVEYNRIPFNDKYAPANWDYEKFGRPDIIYRKLNKDTNNATIQKNIT